MGKSLQEQFLKMGLVDKKKFNETKKSRHKQKKDKQTGESSTDIAEMSKQALAEKRKKDQQLNKKKIAEREAKEAAAKARQLIETHKVAMENGDVPYNFKDSNTIKKIFLPQKTIDKLVQGKLGIVKQAGQYQFVPADTIYKIRELNPNLVVLLNTPSTKEKKENDPYAEFEVPDDLMW